MVGCNESYEFQQEDDGTVSMPHAASGRLQQDTPMTEKGAQLLFQCRTRQVVGCNTYFVTGEEAVKWFQCRTRQVVGCNSTMSEAP